MRSPTQRLIGQMLDVAEKFRPFAEEMVFEFTKLACAERALG